MELFLSGLLSTEFSLIPEETGAVLEEGAATFSTRSILVGNDALSSSLLAARRSSSCFSFSSKFNYSSFSDSTSISYVLLIVGLGVGSSFTSVISQIIGGSKDFSCTTFGNSIDSETISSATIIPCAS